MLLYLMRRLKTAAQRINHRSAANFLHIVEAP